MIARLADLWRRERQAARERAAEERRGLTLAARVERGTAARDLSYVDSGAAPGGRARVVLSSARPRELDDLRIGPGDPVRLWQEAPDEEGAIPAVVARRAPGTLSVVVDGEADRLTEGKWQLDREEPEATFDRGDRALSRLSLAKPGSDLALLRAVLLGERAPESDALPAFTPFDASLHPAQLAAVGRALAARDVALIHGPPGTGKTRTLVEVIRQAVARGERVLATAASNTAVDNLAERLVAAGLEVVRLGHPARVSAAVEDSSLDARLERSESYGLARRWLAEADELASRARKRRARGALDGAGLREALDEAGRLRRDARRHLREAEKAILARAEVVCATAAGADADEDPFDLVVLDEATQAVDPVALCALVRGRRAVLAGDPLQLPPTVIDRDAAREGLMTTFFERLAPTSPPSLLVEQHRMHEKIMAFPSRSLYGGALVAAPEVAAHTLEDLGVAADPLRPGPLLFVDIAGKGWSDERAEADASTRNPQMAARTAAEARRLLGRGLPPEQLAVITPYDAQVRLLRDLLQAEREAGLEIGTVDGFQGREKEAVIVDLVRSNEDGDLGFLSDVRRMNVALTRARRFLLVLGDSATLGGHPFYRAFLEAVDGEGVIVSAWADEADPW